MTQYRIHHLVFEACVVSVLLHLALSACIIPMGDLPNGSIRYQRRRELKSTKGQETHILSFRCNRGYMRLGPRVIFCNDDEWTAEVPQCIEMECEEPPSIFNGKYTVKTGVDGKRTIGSTATYSCDTGFELENDTTAVLTCELDLQTNGVHWSNLTPRCKEKKSCPDPGVSVDGERKGHCCFVGDVVKYSCKEGFELVGIDTLVCLPTGNWSELRPLCRPLNKHCSLPPSIIHGSVIGQKEGDFYLPYDEVEIICEAGFKYPGYEFNLCLEEIGWEEDFYECEEIFCEQPEPLGNGSIPEVQSTNITAFPYDFEITYVCDEGYRLIGDSWRFCSEKGWSRDTPYCEEIRCPDPGVPEHGLSFGTSLKVGSKVIFDCQDGYTLIGSFERYCMPNGQWDGEVARCDNKCNYCPNPGIPVNGMKNSSDYDMRSKIHFQCRPGYALMGSDVIECLPNRTWSAKDIKCIGPYEFDNSDRVKEILKLRLEEIARQQRILDLHHSNRFILYFVFDTSSRIRERNFRKIVEFAKAIIKKVGVSEYGARVGALTFDSNAEIAFLPTTYKRTEDVLGALDEIKYPGSGTTEVWSSLSLIRNFFSVIQEVLGIRREKSIIFILTNGLANMGDSILGAELLKKAGMEIYTIGITSSRPRMSLIQIASEPKNEHAFILQNYAVFEQLSKEIKDLTVDYSRCGLRPKHSRITKGEIPTSGGEAAETWPWMAALYFTSFEDTNMKCSGSIIHDLYILTTAHCVYYEAVDERRKHNKISVHLGLTDMQNKTYEQVIDVKKLYIHEKYRYDGNFDYDIALLKLERPIVYNAFVRPICLPPTNLSLNSTLYKPNETAIVTGWGMDVGEDGGKRVPFRMRRHLKEVILTLQSKENCVDFLKTRPKKTVFTERMLCAGGDGEDTCAGDSGSPLMQPQFDSDGNIYWTQIGITGWGFTPCGQGGSYGFYSHVQNMVSWITETINRTINE